MENHRYYPNQMQDFQCHGAEQIGADFARLTVRLERRLFHLRPLLHRCMLTANKIKSEVCHVHWTFLFFFSRKVFLRFKGFLLMT